MKQASYGTEKGAQRYADDLLRHFGETIDTISVVPITGFRYGVLIRFKNSKWAMAGKRTNMRQWVVNPPTID